MKILNRDDTEHGVEYVTRADAEKEIEGWKDYATDACCTLRCERDEARRLAKELFDLQCWAMLAGDGGDKLPLTFPAWLSEENVTAHPPHGRGKTSPKE